jgi:RES domain-containing protein
VSPPEVPSDLGERVRTAPRNVYEGPAFRQQSPRHDPLSGEGARIVGGRFNPPQSFAVLYLCTTRACAVAEYRRFAGRHPIGPGAFLPRALYQYDVALSSVLDVSDDAVFVHLGLEPAHLVDEDRTMTQHLGAVAQHAGYQAVRSPSATGIDDVLAVFVDNLAEGRLEPRLSEHWESLADL